METINSIVVRVSLALATGNYNEVRVITNPLSYQTKIEICNNLPSNKQQLFNNLVF